ncbi:lanthionine synthetase LanC family protein [Cystobacter fuscus]
MSRRALPSSQLAPPRCYGDPGAVVCLRVAARALSDGELERVALELAREAARRPMAQAGVRDAAICHGSAGLGHLYNRLYQSSREPVFKEAATAWFAQTLEMRRPGEGLAGYLSWYPKTDEDEEEEEELGRGMDGSLLEGAAGTALTLLAACHPFPPTWDGMLLAAIPD